MLSDPSQRPTTRTDLRCAAAVALVLVSLAALGPDAAFFVGRPVEILERVTEPFDGGVLGQPAAFEVAGFSPSVDGWALAPGEQGRLTYRIPTRPDWKMLLRVWLYRPHPQITNTVTVSLGPGGPARVLGRDVHWPGQWIDLARYAGQSLVSLEVAVVNGGDAKSLVLDRIDTQWYREPPLPRLIAHPDSPGYDRLPPGLAPAPPAIRVASWAGALALGLSLLASLRRRPLPYRRIAGITIAASLGMLALLAFLTRSQSLG